MRFAFVSSREKLETTGAPFLRTNDRYWFSSGVLVLVLLPLYILAAGRLGLKQIILLIVISAAGALTETVGAYVTKRPLNYLGIAPWVLFPLMIPPGVPLWMSVTCFIVSSVITVVLFGGYGRHIVHPAVFGQLFFMVNFTKIFNASYLKTFSNPLFGLKHYSSLSFTGKTLLKSLNSGEYPSLEALLSGPHIGNAMEMFPSLVIILGIIYMMLSDVNYRTPITFIVSIALFSTAGGIVFPGAVTPPAETLLGGATLFFAFFIFSDNWTSARTPGGRIIAGATAAFLTIIIRSFSPLAEGVFFAALLNYLFSPLYDELSMIGKKKGSAKP